MSIWHLKLPDKTREKIEIHAERDHLTPADWLTRWIELSVQEPLPEEKWIEQELLKAVNDPRPPIVADAAFWKKLEEEVMAKIEARRREEERNPFVPNVEIES